MKNQFIFILLLSGCTHVENENNKFDSSQFGATASIAMHNLNSTRPVDYLVVQPLRDLETLCASYDFSPQKTRSEMMNLLYEAGYEDFKKSSPTLGMDKVLIISARRSADLAFQVCDNSYRTRHGLEFKPVKLKPSEYYSGTDWNQ